MTIQVRSMHVQLFVCIFYLDQKNNNNLDHLSHFSHPAILFAQYSNDTKVAKYYKEFRMPIAYINSRKIIILRKDYKQGD
jgi:hypothetical protein